MKILSIGDLHGKRIWETVDATKYDQVIFTGDLYDAFEYTMDEIHDNALAVVQWAKDQGNVFFCIGNHDAHYFKWQTPVFRLVRGSGYNEKQLYRAYHLYIENSELFKVAYQIGNYLWSHGGLSDSSYEHHFKRKIPDIIESFDKVNTIADALNKLWKLNDESIVAVPASRGGDDPYGGPLWASKKDTINEPLSGFHQIVGHTSVQDILHNKINSDTSITYIDCLNFKQGKFYEIEI